MMVFYQERRAVLLSTPGARTIGTNRTAKLGNRAHSDTAAILIVTAT